MARSCKKKTTRRRVKTKPSKSRTCKKGKVRDKKSKRCRKKKKKGKRSKSKRRVKKSRMHRSHSHRSKPPKRLGSSGARSPASSSSSFKTRNLATAGQALMKARRENQYLQKQVERLQQTCELVQPQQRLITVKDVAQEEGIHLSVGEVSKIGKTFKGIANLRPEIQTFQKGETKRVTDRKLGGYKKITFPVTAYENTPEIRQLIINTINDFIEDERPIGSLYRRPPCPRPSSPRPSSPRPLSPRPLSRAPSFTQEDQYEMDAMLDDYDMDEDEMDEAEMDAILGGNY
jgi:hypothetical protein